MYQHLQFSLSLENKLFQHDWRSLTAGWPDENQTEVGCSKSVIFFCSIIKWNQMFIRSSFSNMWFLPCVLSVSQQFSCRTMWSVTQQARQSSSLKLKTLKEWNVSPDLNLMENLWKILGDKIMGYKPTAVTELWKRLKRKKSWLRSPCICCLQISSSYSEQWHFKLILTAVETFRNLWATKILILKLLKMIFLRIFLRLEKMSQVLNVVGETSPDDDSYEKIIC